VPVVFFVFPTPLSSQSLTLSLHDALPISRCRHSASASGVPAVVAAGRSRHPPGDGPRRGTRCAHSCGAPGGWPSPPPSTRAPARSEEHTSELQSRFDLVCRLLLEKKKKQL